MTYTVLGGAAKSCPTLCDPMDCNLPDSSVHGDSPGKDTGVSCQTLLQGIFPTQGSNPGLPHCRRMLYHLSHQGSPRILKSVAIPSPEDCPTQESNQGLLHCRWILYQLSFQGRLRTHMENDNPRERPEVCHQLLPLSVSLEV